MWISTAATKPFLRQIETLRSAHSAQTANWEKVEADMTHRLGIFMINFYHVFVVKCEAKKNIVCDSWVRKSEDLSVKLCWNKPKKKKASRGWFRSIDLWVMGPARSHCATLLLVGCMMKFMSFIHTQLKPRPS